MIAADVLARCLLALGVGIALTVVGLVAAVAVGCAAAAAFDELEGVS